MARFDVYRNDDADTSGDIPFVLVVQNDLHDHLATRLIIPLVRVTAQSVLFAPLLAPRFDILGEAVFASVPELGAIPTKQFGAKVASLENQRDIILQAIDFLVSGF